MELEPVNQGLLVDYINNSLITGKDPDPFTKPSPVGLIGYGNKKLAFVGATWEGDLVVKQEDLKEEFDPSQLIDTKGRLFNLDHLDELIIAQLDDNRVETGIFPSAYSKPSAGIRLAYQNPLLKTDGAFFLNEEGLLDVLTGKSGGIAVFQGFGLPEENALLVEKEAGDKKLGWLFFFHPKQDKKNWGIDSVTGLNIFFKTFNRALLEESPNAIQREAVDALDRELELDLLKIGSSVREEIFRSQVIANARLEYLDFLKRHLVTFRSPLTYQALFLRKFLDINILPNKNRLVSESIDSIILGERKEQEEGDIYSKVKTTWLKSARKMVENYYGSDNDQMKDYIKFLANRVISASTREEFIDIEILLKEWENWSLSGENYQLSVHFSDTASVVTRSRGWNWKSDILQIFKERIKLQKARHFIN